MRRRFCVTWWPRHGSSAMISNIMLWEFKAVGSSSSQCHYNSTTHTLAKSTHKITPFYLPHHECTRTPVWANILHKELCYKLTLGTFRQLIFTQLAPCNLITQSTRTVSRNVYLGVIAQPRRGRYHYHWAALLIQNTAALSHCHRAITESDSD